MGRPILVPLDGSTLAEQALPVAAALAEATGSPLLLLCASYVASVPGFDATDEQVRAITEAEAYLHRVASRLEQRGLAVTTYTPYGQARRVIAREARAHDAWLIAMATHGRGGLGRVLYGSVASGVVRQSPVPILLVRAWHGGEGRADLSAAGPILVPLDGSIHAEGALPVARSLATALRARVILAQAIPPRDIALAPAAMIMADPNEADTGEVCEARHYLEGRAALLAEHGIEVLTTVRTGPPADVIAALAEEHGAALTVLATHGRTGLDRALIGSVAERVVRHGATPVVLVRPGQGETLPEPLGHTGPSPADGRSDR